MVDFQKELVLLTGIAMILFIWFETSAFIEWAKLLRIKRLVQPYLEVQQSNVGHLYAKNYVDFLNYKYGKNFIVKILVCQDCLGVWLNILTIPFVGVMAFFPNVYVSLILFNILRRCSKHE